MTNGPTGAEEYITGDAQNFTQRTAEVLAQAIGPGTGPLLDLACGTGIYGQTLSTLGWTPFGVDLSVGQLTNEADAGSRG